MFFASIEIWSFCALMFLGHLPWTESNSSKCADIAASPEISLIPTHSNSGISKPALKTSLPILPKPLMPIRIDMQTAFAQSYTYRRSMLQFLERERIRQLIGAYLVYWVYSTTPIIFETTQQLISRRFPCRNNLVKHIEEVCLVCARSV